jgi:hypothetical protein
MMYSGEPTDWVAWHAPYVDPGSSLSRRRRVVQQHVRDWLEALPDDHAGARVVSACAGDGRDVLEVLRDTGTGDVQVLLLETEGRLAAAAVAFAELHALEGITVRVEDAGTTTAYRDAVPAHLVLLCGVFGNVDPADVRRCVAALPQLCAPGATVLWTRGRDDDGSLRAADDARAALAAAGFDELAFTAPDDAHFAVGAHRLVAEPAAWRAGQRLFTFVR